jgi:hypothetical protein|tara:strand:+ start:409 stop:600 length:192 start_codon:yes stop_codon:yes gene_type:complete
LDYRWHFDKHIDEWWETNDKDKYIKETTNENFKDIIGTSNLDKKPERKYHRIWNRLFGKKDRS